jgi:hypothetical protein
MFGAMALLHLDMNFMNIFVTTMIIGIGTDYAIYILHRHEEMRDQPAETAEAALAETGKGVLLARSPPWWASARSPRRTTRGCSRWATSPDWAPVHLCREHHHLPALLSLLRRSRDRRRDVQA